MRLIDADALVQELGKMQVPTTSEFFVVAKCVDIVKYAPTVDIKTEVAREIFAEIETTIKGMLVLIKFNYMSSVKEKELKIRCYQDVLEYVAELKNKYTKEGVGNESKKTSRDET